MATLFDSYRSSYDNVVEDSVSFSGLKHDFFLEAKADLLARLIVERRLVGHPDGPRTLDVGCGIGALHPYLSKILPRLEGCDISSESIERARMDNPDVAYQSYIAPSLPYSDNTFDLAFAVCVMHHVIPQDWCGFIREMKRIVRPGGCVTIIEHNPLNPLTRLAVLRCPFDEDAVLLSHRKTARLLQDSGLRNVRSEYFLLLPTKARPARSVERALSRLPFGAQYATSAIV
ncbi:class I SAM-dependent methyltransferase [Hoeflea poritis]|uniref:Methyltransferase domain-containing protein n=1 Tax=Hoeflea poritis TaxID=2993659 RepID=A0ABT4VKT4_9HYPH|nr:class I SAM-dependent methyltransferase [Hoeflea poritis]MDA4845323.1 methyltransferase domain-containing protein [Hoeflea poritis]